MTISSTPDAEIPYRNMSPEQRADIERAAQRLQDADDVARGPDRPPSHEIEDGTDE